MNTKAAVQYIRISLQLARCPGLPVSYFNCHKEVETQHTRKPSVRKSQIKVGGGIGLILLLARIVL